MPYVVPPAAAKLSVCHLYRLHPPHITLVYGMAEFRTRFTDAAYSISVSGMFSGRSRIVRRIVVVLRTRPIIVICFVFTRRTSLPVDNPFSLYCFHPVACFPIFSISRANTATFLVSITFCSAHTRSNICNMLNFDKNSLISSTFS